jgi:hypothetical protein
VRLRKYEPHPESEVGMRIAREKMEREREEYRKANNIQPLGPDDPIPDLAALCAIPFREDGPVTGDACPPSFLDGAPPPH